MKEKSWFQVSLGAKIKACGEKKKLLHFSFAALLHLVNGKEAELPHDRGGVPVEGVYS